MNKSGKDPLRPKNLENRIKLFETVCLPSVLSQLEQDFSWVLIVDEKLPDKYRHKLEQLLEDRPNTYLHSFSPGTKVWTLQWLKAYIKQDRTHIVTTKLDDDDALYSGFTRYIRQYLTQLENRQVLKPICFLACKNEVLWDFFWSKDAKLGYQKARNTKTRFPTSAGYTLCCKYPELDFSVLSFGHVKFPLLASDSKEFFNKNENTREAVLQNREKIKAAAKAASLTWDGELLREENFHILETETPQVVIVNHLSNIEYHRLLSNPEQRKAVSIGSLSPVEVNYSLATETIKPYRKSFKMVFLILVTILKLNSKVVKNKDFRTRAKMKISLFIKAMKGIKNMK